MFLRKIESSDLKRERNLLVGRLSFFQNFLQSFALAAVQILFVVLLMAGCAPSVEPYTPTTPTFTNVADEVGLDFQHGAFRWGFSGDPVAMMGGGLCWIDYDNDGWLDLYVINSYAVAEAGRWQSEEGGLPTNALFHNKEGVFEDVSAETNTNLAMRGNGCVAADFNLDGFSDLYITSSRFNALLWNNGDGTFREGAKTANVGTYGWQTAAAVGDINADGWPDLFLAGYVDVNNDIEGSTMGFPNTKLGRPDLIFINQGVNDSGEAIFVEAHETVGLVEFDEDSEHEYGLGASLSDVDGDGDLDLFVANDTNPNRLYINHPTDTNEFGFELVEQGASANIDDINSGMGVASGDYDEDGRFDLFITNMGPQTHSIYQNNSAETPTFTDAVNQFGITNFGVGWTGWGTTWADFDLDSDLDLVVANGGVPVLDFETDAMFVQLYENQTADGALGQFSDASVAVGMRQIGPLVGRGSAVADYDNDGDLDIAIGTIGGKLVLLENAGANGNWLQVRLDGFAPGTIVTATLPDGRELRREIKTGSSYLASEDPRCHFGLGSAESVTQLQIQWPDGAETIMNNVKANQIIDVKY